MKKIFLIIAAVIALGMIAPSVSKANCYHGHGHQHRGYNHHGYVHKNKYYGQHFNHPGHYYRHFDHGYSHHYNKRLIFRPTIVISPYRY